MMRDDVLLAVSGFGEKDLAFSAPKSSEMEKSWLESEMRY